MKTKEQEAAEILQKLNGLFEGDDSLSSIVDRFKHLEEKVEGLDGLDIPKALEEFDRLRTAQEMLTKAIKTTRSGVYVPGLEDESERFSLLRALIGIKRGKGDWTNVKAGHEKKVLDAVREKAAQSIGDDSLGGYFVPDQVIPDVIGAIYTASVFISLDGEGETVATVLNGLVGGNVKIPKFDGGTVAFWIGEEEAYTESQAAVGDISMNPKKAGVLVKLTDAMQRFAGFGFDALLRRDVTKAAASLVDNAILYGRGGDNQPRGIAYHPDIKVFSAEAGASAANTAAGLASLQADWAGAELDFDGLELMDLILEEDDITMDGSYRTVFAPRYRRRLGQLKIENYSGQSAGNPYLLGSPMINDARIADLIGAFSKFNQIGTTGVPGVSVSAPTTSTTAKFTDVLKGNLAEVIVGRWGGIEVEDDRGLTNFTTDHTLLKLRMYMDVQIRQPRAVILCPDAQARD